MEVAAAVLVRDQALFARRDGRILLVEQNARQALRVADYGFVLEGGRIRQHGPSAELAARPADSGCL